MHAAGSEPTLWDRLLDHLIHNPPPASEPKPPEPTPPKVDEGAWAKSVDRARVSDSLTVHDLGLIVFNESQSYSDRHDSNEPIAIAREKMAQAIINGDHKWGVARQQHAGTALAVEPSSKALDNPAVRAAYESSMKAAREAYLSGMDPTKGAVFLNQRGDPGRYNRVFDKSKPAGVPLSTQSGPYDNSYIKGKVKSSRAWLNTYHDE